MLFLATYQAHEAKSQLEGEEEPWEDAEEYGARDGEWLQAAWGQGNPQYTHCTADGTGPTAGLLHWPSTSHRGRDIWWVYCPTGMALQKCEHHNQASWLAHSSSENVFYSFPSPLIIKCARCHQNELYKSTNWWKPSWYARCSNCLVCEVWLL